MKAFKIVALIFLGIFLSLSLLVFGIALTLNQSLLNPDFIADHVDSLDIADLADEIITEQVPDEAADFMGESLDIVLTDVINDLEPWIKEQAREGIDVFYDYIEGRSQSLSLTISLEAMKESLRENLLAAILDSPPVELFGFLTEEIELEFDIYWSQIEDEIPSTLEIYDTMLDAETMEQIEQVKEYVGYFNLAFILLIAFILLMIALIIVVYRTVRGSTRQIGITFLGVGAISLAVALIVRSVANSQIAQSVTSDWIAQGNLPTTFQTWMTQLVTDVLMPLGIYAIGLIVVGIALTVISFVYKRDEYSDYYY